MGSMSIWHWLIVLAVVLVLFGGGSKISSLMGDFGKGLKSFKKNIADEDHAGTHPATPTGSLSSPDATYHAQAQQPGAAPYVAPSSAPGSVPVEPVRHG